MPVQFIRLTKYYLLKFIQLPVSLWMKYQWANLRRREEDHLLSLNDYLLRDMGLRKVGNRIEAIDASRIEAGRDIFDESASITFSNERVHQSN